MSYLIIVLVCFFSSAIGAICGIGGGVIIKPVLDAAGIMPVTTISFLSGCTVLSMSFVSLYKNLKSKRNFEFNQKVAFILASGAVAGGITGKEIYQNIVEHLTDTGRVGAIQAVVLAIITMGTLLYTLQKEKIRTKHLKHKAIIFLTGVMLGIMSSFLGIGGGPVNLVVLYYFFSMTTKPAAVYSIYIILFSQMSSVIYTILKGNVPPFELPILVLMVLCGILGGYTGSRVNQLLDDRMVDRLFMGLMSVIICICCYNVVHYM